MYTNDANNNVTGPVMITTTDPISNIKTTLSDIVFIELNILSGKTTQKELKNYELELEEYHRGLDRAETLGIDYNEAKPQEPDFKIEYRKTWWNIADKDIHSWHNDWDEERQCEIVVLDYSYNGIIDQINIKITQKEWIELLNSFGATHIKL